MIVRCLQRPSIPPRSPYYKYTPRLFPTVDLLELGSDTTTEAAIQLKAPESAELTPPQFVLQPRPTQHSLRRRYYYKSRYSTNFGPDRPVRRTPTTNRCVWHLQHCNTTASDTMCDNSFVNFLLPYSLSTRRDM